MVAHWNTWNTFRIFVRQERFSLPTKTAVSKAASSRNVTNAVRSKTTSRVNDADRHLARSCAFTKSRSAANALRRLLAPLVAKLSATPWNPTWGLAVTWWVAPPRAVPTRCAEATAVRRTTCCLICYWSIGSPGLPFGRHNIPGVSKRATDTKLSVMVAHWNTWNTFRIFVRQERFSLPTKTAVSKAASSRNVTNAVRSKTTSRVNDADRHLARSCAFTKSRSAANALRRLLAPLVAKLSATPWNPTWGLAVTWWVAPPRAVPTRCAASPNA